jgi:hypothetical protein
MANASLQWLVVSPRVFDHLDKGRCARRIEPNGPRVSPDVMVSISKQIPGCTGSISKKSPGQQEYVGRVRNMPIYLEDKIAGQIRSFYVRMFRSSREG